MWIYDEDGNAATNNITINRGGSVDTIGTDGATSLVIDGNYGGVELTFDDDHNVWNVVAKPLSTSSVAKPKQSVTLGAAATSFAVTSDFVVVTGDAGANTVATITGGVDGQRITLLFVDALVTITDDNTHGADSVDLSASFTSADDTTLELIYDGTSWYEVSRSTN